MRKLVISLVTMLLLATTAAMAWGASTAVQDPRGDAPPAVDVTAVRVDNSQHAVRIHIRFAHLEASRVRSVRTELDVGKLLGIGYELIFKRRASGGFDKQLLRVRLYAEGTTRPRCPGLRLAWGDNRADIRLPRSCMRAAHEQRLRANVTVVSVDRKRDRVPKEFLSFTPWVARG